MDYIKFLGTAGARVIVSKQLRASGGAWLCLDDTKKIIGEVRPRVAILTHFGMTILRAKPWKLAEQLGKELGLKVIAASDGMMFEPEKWEKITN